MTDDLITWLRTQLDDDELTARAALDYAAEGEPVALDAVGGIVVGDRAINPAASDHILRWHPRRALAEVEAKRRILDGLERGLGAIKEDWEWQTAEGGWTAGVEFAARCLALPYADRPGYLEEWRP